VGLFSFLTGAKDDKRDGGASDAESKTPNLQELADTGNPLSAPRPEPDAHPPFTPPEAWNTEALTQPAPAPTGDVPQVGPVDKDVTAELQGKVIDVIKTVYDPEIPVDIYELGLIYDVIADKERRVLVKMTLTSPACPSAQQIPSEVRYKVKSIPGVTDAWVDVVWDPPWTKDRMSEAAKLTLGIF